METDPSEVLCIILVSSAGCDLRSIPVRNIKVLIEKKITFASLAIFYTLLMMVVKSWQHDQTNLDKKKSHSTYLCMFLLFKKDLASVHFIPLIKSGFLHNLGGHQHYESNKQKFCLITMSFLYKKNISYLLAKLCSNINMES